MMDVNNIKTEYLIAEIENEPAIWDTASDAYSNKLIRKNAWERVICKFVDDFFEKPAVEQNKIVTVFYRKWKSLRDSFAREISKQRKEKFLSITTSRKQYIYFNQLSFLQTVIKESKPGIKDEVGDMEDGSANNVDDIVFPVTSSSSKKKRKSSKSSLEPQDDLATILKKRITSDSENPMESYADTLFMLSLVPEMQQIPEKMKLEVKCDLMRVLHEAKIRHFSTLNFFPNGHTQQYHSVNQQFSQAPLANQQYYNPTTPAPSLRDYTSTNQQLHNASAQIRHKGHN